jgi:hypothetical protein
MVFGGGGQVGYPITIATSKQADGRLQQAVDLLSADRCLLEEHLLRAVSRNRRPRGAPLLASRKRRSFSIFGGWSQPGCAPQRKPSEVVNKRGTIIARGARRVCLAQSPSGRGTICKPNCKRTARHHTVPAITREDGHYKRVEPKNTVKPRKRRTPKPDPVFAINCTRMSGVVCN